MAKVVGQVDKLVQKTTAQGKAWFSVLVNGQLYSLWQSPNFKAGDVIEFDEIIKGQYKNMANPEVSKAPLVADSGSMVRTKRPDGSFDPDRESRIVRQNATSSAVALVSASKIAGKQDIDSLLAVVKETAKNIFRMNMYGYDFDEQVVESARTEEAKPAAKKSGEVDELFKGL